MRFSKIPFVKGSALMDGLAPAVAQSPAMKSARKRRNLRPGRLLSGYGPQFPNSSMLGASFGPGGHTTLSRFFAEEAANNSNGIVNDVDPLFRNNEQHPFGLDGLGDSLPPGTSTTVMLRPQPNAPAGFPGFFAWLKSEQPDMWNYAKVALPAYVTQAEGKRTGGATLSGLGAPHGDNPGHRTVWAVSPVRPGFFGEEQANSPLDDIQNTRDPMFSRNTYNPDMDGLGYIGDDTTDDTDLSLISPVSTDVIAITPPLPTVAIPDTSAETSNTSTPPNPGPGAVSQIVSTLTAAAPSILNTVNQQTVFNAQLARAQAGLPPLNTTAYGLPSSIASIASNPIALLAIGGGILALALMSKK